MSQVAVLTDSCASISECLQIQTVAIYIHGGAEVLRDLVTIRREEFPRWMTTAQFLSTRPVRDRAAGVITHSSVEARSLPNSAYIGTQFQRVVYFLQMTSPERLY